MASSFGSQGGHKPNDGLSSNTSFILVKFTFFKIAAFAVLGREDSETKARSKNIMLQIIGLYALS